jgi:hypothetical protein
LRSDATIRVGQSPNGWLGGQLTALGTGCDVCDTEVGVVGVAGVHPDPIASTATRTTRFVIAMWSVACWHLGDFRATGWIRDRDGGRAAFRQKDPGVETKRARTRDFLEDMTQYARLGPWSRFVANAIRPGKPPSFIRLQ